MKFSEEIKKPKYLLKGIGTYLPKSIRGLLPLHQHQFYDDGSIREIPMDARQCYATWMRYLVALKDAGFSIDDYKSVAEIGPGDQLGVGLASFLTGTNKFYAFDVVRYAAQKRNYVLLDDLIKLYVSKEPIPNQQELAKLRPELNSYEFPSQILTDERLKASLNENRIQDIRDILKEIIENGKQGYEKNGMGITYVAPWDDPSVIEEGSIDLMHSQAAMEHVEDIEKVYHAASLWLRKGGIFMHAIDLKSHHAAGVWNAHWIYSNFLWRIVRGRIRNFFINRMPHSEHIKALKKYGFEIVKEDVYRRKNIFQRKDFAKNYDKFTDDDYEIAESVIIGYKK